ncbi:hypothetical protein APHNP_0912 [Anaplasma phagocytophilum str. ApNP]|uniref:Uncharacterized protein n=1 Tax=Anaplasma phagocytophilum str. ApNP TaxID=1359153 RepID=A0A0F3NIH2_ANAPH|nr:hypothetical protein APHNP_0912 [Anaplasma phagocytophilum str. ApNP]
MPLPTDDNITTLEYYQLKISRLNNTLLKIISQYFPYRILRQT